MKHRRTVIVALAAATLFVFFGCSRRELPSCKGGEHIARAVQAAQAGRQEALTKFIASYSIEGQAIEATANGNIVEAAVPNLRAATDRAIRYVAETDAAEWKRLCVD